MFSFHQALSGPAHVLRTSKGSGKSRKASANRPNLRLEVLEERQLLTMTPIGAPATTQDAYLSVPQTAMDAQGDYVVVWESIGGDGSGTGIKARRYDASGAAVGDTFVVNTFTTGDQKAPRVAMNDSGDFVVVWQSAGQDGSGWGVFAQRYDAAGAPLGNEFQVNTITADEQTAPDVALNDSGQFAISWQHSAPGSFQGRLRAASFRADGVASSGEVTVTTTSSTSTGVGIDAAGNFVAANLGSARRYSFAGAPQGTPYAVPTGYPDTTKETRVHVAMNNSGEFILAASGIETIAQRFNSAGDSQGARIQLGIEARQSFLAQSDFGLALDDAGNSLFSVISYSLEVPSATSPVKLYQFDANGLPAGNTSVGTSGGLSLIQSSVAINSAGQAVVAWFDYDAADPSGPNLVVTQRLQRTDFRLTGLATGQDEDLLPGVPPVTEVRALVASFSLPASTGGGAAGSASVLNPANWQLLRGNVDISDLITSITYADGRASLALAAPLATGGYRLIARDSIEQLGGGMLDGDSNGVAGGDSVSEFKIGPTFPVGDQQTLSPAHEPLSNPSGFTSRAVVAANAAGASVTVVVTGQSLASQIVTAQRYDATGAAVGDPIVIASQVPFSNQEFVEMKVAVGMADDGGFVVAWNPMNQLAILVQRFNRDGVAVGPVLQVSDPSTAQTRLMGLAVSGAGTFSVASSPTDHPRVAMFSADGTSVAQFNATLGDRSRSGIGLAYTSAGELITTWEGSGRINNVGSPQGSGIYALRFDATGQPISDLIFVARQTSALDTVPRVAANPAGGFAIAWQALPHTDSPDPDFGVFARIYDAQALPVTAEFRVNSEPIIGYGVRPIVPALAFDSANHLLVAWESNTQNIGFQFDISGRTFFDNGTPLANQFRLNTITNRNQFGPAVAAGAAGQFIAAWFDDNPQLQRLRVIDPPVVDVNGLSQGLNFLANQFEPGAGSISLADAGLSISDSNTSQIASGRIAIANPLSGDVLSVDTSGTAVVASYVDGVLTLTGVDSLEHYAQVLRTVRFDSSAIRPNATVVEIGFSVHDSLGIDGAVTFSRLSYYVPGSASVVGRFLFYNNSVFDGTPTIDSNDFRALASDKTPYLPGSGLATFNSVSSYTRGINDLAFDLAGAHAALEASDLSFRVGNSNSLGDWIEAPAPSSFEMWYGSGVNGSDRVYIVWPDGAIKNTWLEVTVAANSRTGLATPDVFYFGNLVGDTGGNPAGLAMTNTVDSLAIRFHPGANQPVTSLYDIDRNGMVNAADELAARSNPGSLRMLNLPPIVVAAAQAAPQTVASDAVDRDAGLAFALALGMKPELEPTAVTRSVSVEPLALTASQAAREAAVAAIVADERVSFDPTTSEASAEESPSDDWLSLALD